MKLSNKFVALSVVAHVLVYGAIIAYHTKGDNPLVILWVVSLLLGSCVGLYKNVNIEDIVIKKRYIILDATFPLFILSCYNLGARFITNAYLSNFIDAILLFALSAYIYRYYKAIGDGRIIFTNR